MGRCFDSGAILLLLFLLVMTAAPLKPYLEDESQVPSEYAGLIRLHALTKDM